MFKTISAALLAVSVIAAPAFAATGKTAPAVKPTAAKSSVLNANARMGKHHHKHARNYHHRNHHKYGAIKTHAKVGFKRAAPVSTRHG
jgi:Ni/Co efflux regulator RcnB